MISAFVSTWKVPELRQRILFTLAVVVIVRLGVHVTLPGVDATVIAKYLAEKQASGGDSGPGAAIGTMLGIFSGGGASADGCLRFRNHAIYFGIHYDATYDRSSA